ncbi:amino acid/amide ABC transporter ATP-binding protein 1, HAAT family [Methylobacterium sp. 174MFSha1.1]|uniref:ABC transporter ATP-binding protein n=1 Tax=Methylobacterium sp. 174MFSha1.1 TaxID=1502749 RepID=UPI0008E95130|nr:ABC transporter ATP-binding protein [Methylobacterium sp. 174MFSha1.1]SFV08925.1 amino acid/amide ABC transporter ATP-binding protein 1, HAAT family [Methylobacterium sp. 174MFSha1.1]
MTALLAIEHLSSAFGGLQVLQDLSFTVPKGPATALIGPNGAGKTTVFNLVSGVYRPTGGRILLAGHDITALPSRRRIRHGIARSFQNVRLMDHLSVVENLLVGQHATTRGLRDLLVPFRLVPNHRWRREAIDALAEAGLAAYADAAVGALPYGIRKRVDLVRATLAGASLLMLDEPAAGLNPTETNALRDHLALLRRRGVTLLIVEHDMPFVGEVCEHVVVLDFGQKLAEGTLAQVQRDERVRAAYLGQEA